MSRDAPAAAANDDYTDRLYIRFVYQDLPFSWRSNCPCVGYTANCQHVNLPGIPATLILPGLTVHILNQEDSASLREIRHARGFTSRQDAGTLSVGNLSATHIE